ncbi:putative transcriptional regulator DarR [Mycobacterium xenopi 3993]|nr:putative transcriptional regulator DarR [Mycobacterium xenopi 3993]
MGPFEVFAAASTCLAAQGRDGYQPVLACIDGQPVATPMGLTFATARLPDPHQPSTPWCCPAAAGPRGAGEPAAHRLDPGRRPQRSARRQRLHWRLPGRAGRAARRLHRHHPLGLRRPAPARVPVDHRRPRADLRAQLGDGVDRRRVTAGIDLALSLVEDDHGTDVAQTVARWLVLYLRRPGGQTQFAARCGCPRQT